MIKQFVKEEYWPIINPNRVEEIRLAIRDLVKFLDKEQGEVIYTNFEDEVDENNIKEFDLVKASKGTRDYKERVEAFIRKNKHHLTIDKLNKNLPLTPADVKQLEAFLFDGEERGTREDFSKEFEGQSLGQFIRSIVGLEISVVQEIFAEYLHSTNYTPDQIRFINIIVDHLVKNGTYNKAMLFEPPITYIHQEGLFGHFNEGEVRKVISIVDGINRNAEVG